LLKILKKKKYLNYLINILTTILPKKKKKKQGYQPYTRPRFCNSMLSHLL